MKVTTDSDVLLLTEMNRRIKATVEGTIVLKCALVVFISDTTTVAIILGKYLKLNTRFSVEPYTWQLIYRIADLLIINTNCRIYFINLHTHHCYAPSKYNDNNILLLIPWVLFCLKIFICRIKNSLANLLGSFVFLNWKWRIYNL